MVEVVLSLKTTGQHVSVPIRVQTRSLTSAVASELSADTNVRLPREIQKAVCDVEHHDHISKDSAT